MPRYLRFSPLFVCIAILLATNAFCQLVKAVPGVPVNVTLWDKYNPGFEITIDKDSHVRYWVKGVKIDSLPLFRSGADIYTTKPTRIYSIAASDTLWTMDDTLKSGKWNLYFPVPGIFVGGFTFIYTAEPIKVSEATDANDPLDNTAEGATPLSLTQTSAPHVQSNSDDDWFRFEVQNSPTSGHGCAISVSEGSTPSLLWMELYGSDKKILARGAGKMHAALADGQYLLRIPPTSSPGYTTRVECTNMDSLNAFTSASTSAPMPADTVKGYSLPISKSYWYHFTIPAGSSQKCSLYKNRTTSVSFYASSQGVPSENPTDFNDPVPPGKYYLNASSTLANEPYAFKLDCQSPGDPMATAIALAAEAAPVTLPEGTTYFKLDKNAATNEYWLHVPEITAGDIVLQICDAWGIPYSSYTANLRKVEPGLYYYNNTRPLYLKVTAPGIGSIAVKKPVDQVSGSTTLATALEPGKTSASEQLTGTDNDVYKITVSTPGILSIKIGDTHNNLPEIWYESPSATSGQLTCADRLCEMLIEETGTWFLTVSWPYGTTNTATTGYTLQASLHSGIADLNNIATLTVGETYHGRPMLVVDKDTSLYKITPEKSGYLYLISSTPIHLGLYTVLGDTPTKVYNDDYKHNLAFWGEKGRTYYIYGTIWRDIVSSYTIDIFQDSIYTDITRWSGADQQLPLSIGDTGKGDLFYGENVCYRTTITEPTIVENVIRVNAYQISLVGVKTNYSLDRYSSPARLQPDDYLLCLNQGRSTTNKLYHKDYWKYAVSLQPRTDFGNHNPQSAMRIQENTLYANHPVVAGDSNFYILEVTQAGYYLFENTTSNAKASVALRNGKGDTLVSWNDARYYLLNTLHFPLLVYLEPGTYTYVASGVFSHSFSVRSGATLDELLSASSEIPVVAPRNPQQNLAPTIYHLAKRSHHGTLDLSQLAGIKGSLEIYDQQGRKLHAWKSMPTGTVEVSGTDAVYYLRIGPTHE